MGIMAMMLKAPSSGSDSLDSLIVATPNVVSYCPLRESTGATTALDLVGTDNGTIQSAVTMGVSGIFPGGDTVASFDGTTNSYISYGNPGRSDGAWSVEFEVSPTDLAANRGIIELFDNDGGTYIYITTAGTLSVRRVFNLGSSGSTVSSAAGSLSAGGTFHIVVTSTGAASGNHQQVYVNGGASGAGITSAWNSLSGVSQISFSQDGGAGFPFVTLGLFKGKIGKVAYYNAALSSTAIAAHYAAR